MNRLTRMTTAALMAALTAVSAYLMIPIGVVPITMQSCVVLMAGALLGSRWGALSQAVYVSMGLMGAPVFAGGRGGPGVVLSPTFGYLIGFVGAAFVTGWCLEHRVVMTLPRLVLAMVAGLVVLDAFGLVYLYVHLRFITGQAASWSTVLKLGLFPFLPFDGIKIALAAALVTGVRKATVNHPIHREVIP